MVRGEASLHKVILKKNDVTFLVYAESAELVAKYQKDKTTPLVDVVSTFHVYTTHSSAVSGTIEQASNAELENAFGTKNEDDVIKEILEKGTVQAGEGDARQGSRNESQGGTVAH